VITVSFKGYQNSYKEFCRSIFLDAGFDKKSPLTLSGVINKIKSSHQKILLCIDDFQYFSENPDLDPKYDQKFIDALNSIKHTQHVSLLIVSIKPMDSFVFFIHKKAVTSILDLTIIEMPSLQFSEIKDELNRRSINKCLNENDFQICTAYLNKQKNNYALLDYFELKIKGNDSTLDLEKKMKTWQKKYGKSSHSTYKKLFFKIQLSWI
jgi:hypothetical protein